MNINLGKMKNLILLLMVFCVHSKGLDVETNEESSENCENCCFLPKNFENGKISPRFAEDTLLVPENTVLIYKCRPKFQLKGKKLSICKEGNWLPEIPKCVSKSCQPPPPLEKGEPILQSNIRNFPEGTRVKYKCDSGYEMSGEDELICIKFGSMLIWNRKVPVCTALPQCNDPGVSIDGYRLGECCSRGSVLSYKCNPGFTLIGEDRIECLSDYWSYDRPLCQPEEFCPDPDEIPHGKVIGSKSGDFYQTDDQISVECEKGYKIENGSDIFFCEDGHWDEEFPFCTEIKCDLPKIPTNGSIQEKNRTTFPYEFEVHFACEEGYLLIGNSWSSCGEFGWTLKSPTCQKIRCPAPSAPEGGWINGDSYEVGDVIEFECFSGYQMLGSSRRECLPNGKWSGELTRCDSKENDCPNPGVPISGEKIGRYYKFGDIVEFKCQSGKQLIGSEKRICQNDGEWSGSEAFCLDEKDFDQKESVSFRLEEIINAEKTEEDILIKINELKTNFSSENGSDVYFLSRAININHPDRLVFYFVFDMSGSIGSENFQKSIDFVKLLVTKIGVSEDRARVGVMTFSDKADIKFYPMVYRTTKDVIDALDNIEYSKGGGTATRLALRLLKEDMIPLTEDVLKGKQKPIVFLLTDGKANMEGDPMEDAKELKKYGVEIYCIGITGDRNMKTLFDISNSEEHVFILDSYETIDWLVQDLINGTIDYSAHCGIQKRIKIENNENADDRGRVVGGEKAKQPWPWMAAVYFIDNMHDDISKAQHRCGGSVIDKFWILTAAHCFYDQNNILIPKENIIINLGLLNVKNRTNLQQFQIEEYVIHENYERKTHHNDIALVKLSREAEFNAFVRPICLPPTYSDLPEGTKLYREGERAVAIGWGYNKAVEKHDKSGRAPIDDLKRLNLPLQNGITCSNSLNNSYHFTDAMFCAGSGRGKEDTCKGDSGGPLMQPMINDLGQKYWTQVGIISWGVGCAQRGTYGFYTHVAMLREWIDLTRQK